MTVWFIQEFLEELKIMYLIGEGNKVDEFIVEPPFTTEDVTALVRDHLVTEENMTQVILKGKTTTLRELEQYYKNLGVDVKWQ